MPHRVSAERKPRGAIGEFARSSSTESIGVAHWQDWVRQTGSVRFETSRFVPPGWQVHRFSQRQADSIVFLMQQKCLLFMPEKILHYRPNRTEESGFCEYWALLFIAALVEVSLRSVVARKEEV
jgi:hypothetical protein